MVRGYVGGCNGAWVAAPSAPALSRGTQVAWAGKRMGTYLRGLKGRGGWMRQLCVAVWVSAQVSVCGELQGHHPRLLKCMGSCLWSVMSTPTSPTEMHG